MAQGPPQCLCPSLTKSADQSPLAQRPITVLPVLFRVWASARARDLRPWQDTWAHPDLYGGIANREALQALLETTLDAEAAAVHDESWFAAFLDYYKYFYSISWSMQWPLADHWGLPEACLELVPASMWALLQVQGQWPPWSTLSAQQLHCARRPSCHGLG